MSRQTLYGQFAGIVVVLCILLLSSTPVAFAVPGDPDNDGLSTADEQALGTDPLVADTDGDGLLDAWEVYFLRTDPRLAATNGNTLDSLRDSDGDGIPDGVELANGTDPFDASDTRLKPLRLVAPLPRGPSFAPVAIAPGTPPPFEFAAEIGDFDRFTLQFDSSPDFRLPVEKTMTVTITPGKLSLPVPLGTLWWKVSRKGPVIYWRVLAVDTATGRREYSFPSSFTISGGPTALQDDDDDRGPIDPSAVPTFQWGNNKAGRLTGYRLILTSNQKLGTAVVRIPDKASEWLTSTTLKPTAEQWQAIAALGREIVWYVQGKDAAGHFSWSSERGLLTIGRGASALTTEMNGPAPDAIPVFRANRGWATRYRLLFSGSGDFSQPALVWPATGFADFPGPISYTPDATAWAALTALGPHIHWMIQGVNATATWYTSSESDVLDLGNSLSIAGLNPKTVNVIPPGLPSFALTDSGPGGALRIVFCGDRQLAGKIVTAPAEGFGISNPWSMPGDFPQLVASLDRDFIWVMAQARTEAGNVYHSPPYLLKPEVTLQPPLLAPLGGTIQPGKAYTVSWTASGENPPGSVLSVELQEAMSADFTTGLRSFAVKDGSSQTIDDHLTVPGGVATYYYRARALSALGHSAWSNTVQKKIAAGLPKDPIPATDYRRVYEPFPAGDNSLYVEDDDFENAHPGWGSKLFGPGWRDLCGAGNGLASLHCGAAHRDNYHYLTSATQDYTEWITWRPQIPVSGRYEVWGSFICTPNRAADARYYVFAADGITLYSMNQQKGNPVVGKQLTWCKLGEHRFEAGTAGYVKLINNPDSHSETADAIGFKYLGP